MTQILSLYVEIEHQRIEVDFLVSTQVKPEDMRKVWLAFSTSVYGQTIPGTVDPESGEILLHTSGWLDGLGDHVTMCATGFELLADRRRVIMNRSHMRGGNITARVVGACTRTEIECL